ncbi:hypothetical protein ACVIHI_008409 [Bradyrhizobium sp. USDA 4524]
MTPAPRGSLEIAAPHYRRVSPHDDVANRNLGLDCRNVTLLKRPLHDYGANGGCGASQDVIRRAVGSVVANRKFASASPRACAPPPPPAPGSRLSATIRARSAPERTRRPDGPSSTSSRLTAPGPTDGLSKWASFSPSNPIPNLRSSRRLLRTSNPTPKPGYRTARCWPPTPGTPACTRRPRSGCGSSGHR